MLLAAHASPPARKEHAEVTTPCDSFPVTSTSIRMDDAHVVFGALSLWLAGVIQCTDRDEFSYQEMMAHIPLCSLPVSHPRPGIHLDSEPLSCAPCPGVGMLD